MNTCDWCDRQIPKGEGLCPLHAEEYERIVAERGEEWNN